MPAAPGHCRELLCCAHHCSPAVVQALPGLAAGPWGGAEPQGVKPLLEASEQERDVLVLWTAQEWVQERAEGAWVRQAAPELAARGAWARQVVALLPAQGAAEPALAPGLAWEVVPEAGA